MAAMAIEARSFWLIEPGRGDIRRSTLPPPASGELMVRATASGISRGTECLVFKGAVPASQYQAMRCPFQEGDFPGPVKYGYASVGIVEPGSPALEGRRVFCLYPHQDLYVVPQDAVVPVPDTVPDRRAVLAANMETALNATWDAGARDGDRVAVVGAGVIGCLVAALFAKTQKPRVQLIDTDPRRAAIAAQLGCDFAAPRDARGDNDLVVHASASEAGLTTALALAAFEATVLELSWYGTSRVAVPLGENFHSRRLTLRASQVGAVAPSRRAEIGHRRRLEMALDLLADPVYDHLITGEGRLDELPRTMARLAAAPDGALCEIVRYR
jgi:NADPH:quinone reductase-like Zn-dependent oxidoreductase